MKIENGVTNFAVYEDATEYYGMAEVTLPEITQISEEVKGAGIGSDVLDAMPIKDFNRITNAARSFLIDTGY